MKVGQKFLVEDLNAGEMLSKGWCRVTQPDAGSVDLPPYFMDEADRANAKILFVRPGGFGDLLFLTPSFRELKKRWPECEIWVACFPQFHEALLHNQDVTGFINYPVRIEKYQEFSSQLWLENVIEDERKLHAVDAIWKLVAGNELGELSDKRMRYVVTDEERDKAEKEFPKLSEKRIGLQMGWNQTNLPRTYPQMNELSLQLWRDGYEVFLFGRPGDLKTNEKDRIVNLMMQGKNFREQCAILATCDCVVAPDSVLCHVAGALEIPTVALYGPFPWQLRTAYAKNTRALQGECLVSPCFHHVKHGTGIFPEHGPCRQSHKCEALDLLSVDRICREVEKMLASLRESRRKLKVA